MSSSKIHNASPLDKAKAHELADWERVAKMFTAARSIANPSFVYVIGEEDSGPIKIGTAKCPVTRLRAMQTGNSRRLRIAYALIGARFSLFAHVLVRSHESPGLVLPDKQDLLPYRRALTGGIDFVLRVGVGKAPGTEWFRPEVCEQLFPILDTAVEKQLAQFGGDIYLTSLGQAIRDAHIEHDHVAQGRDHVWNLAPVAGYSVARPSRL